MKRYMGIDYGAYRVGVALSDDSGTCAFPKVILKNDERLLETLAQLITAEDVGHVVVGEADNPAGGENAIARRVAIFARALAVRTELPVDKVTEAYSSAEARRAYDRDEKSRKEKDIFVDAAAAAIILQNYLDTHRRH